MSSNEENGKSEKRLMSIGEVSKAIGITRRIILNYEAKGLLLPDKKEGTAGNRYYTPDSISLIRSIRVLQNLGLSLDEISSYYNGSTDLEPLIERLEALRDDLTQSIEKLKQRTASPAASMIQFLTWCRRCGRLRRPDRERYSRSRSGGHPLRRGRYPHQGVPRAGP